VKSRLLSAYKQIQNRIGNPLDEKFLLGPMIDKTAVDVFLNALEEVKKQGGKVIFGGELLTGEGYESGSYVVPAIAEAENHYSIVQEETFAPLLYLLKYNDFDEAIEIHNDVPQGLSSAIFTLNVREAELFLSTAGSDCGIANVNIGTSGAEIGGAFGEHQQQGGGDIGVANRHRADDSGADGGEAKDDGNFDLACQHIGQNHALIGDQRMQRIRHGVAHDNSAF
jgi:aldehyde dehydrogenase (NAD+)